MKKSFANSHVMELMLRGQQEITASVIARRAFFARRSNLLAEEKEIASSLHSSQ